MNVTIDCVAQRNPAMVFSDLDDAVVIMDVKKGMYYELDAIGARIWTVLETARSVAEVCDLLVREYDVTPDLCRSDVLEFLSRAKELGIILIRAPAAP